MKIWKIILAVLTIIVGILLFAESEDVSRVGQLANALGANVSALTLYAGYIVSILYIVISILLFVYINKKDKQGDIIIIILSLVAFVFSFAGPKRFEDLPFLSFCAVLCLITAIISYIINKRNENRLAEINKQCSHCGARIEDDSRFCSECGKEITHANVCPHCGASVGEGDAFCPNCGKNLSEPIAADNVEQTVEYGEEEESPTKKYLPYILCAIALIALIGGGWWYSNSSKPSQAPNREILTDSIESDSIITAIEEEVPANSEIADSITYFNDEISDETIDQDEEEATYENDNNVSDNPNTCWYIYGTKKELESFKVINANGINTDLNKNYFTKISKNESKTIKLYSNNARVLSSHPNNSYELSTDDNGNYQLNIILPHEFWSVSKYLVIVVDE